MPANAGGGDVMETRGRSRHVEKMGNEAMNFLAQGNS
jgi:hypothetical protein